MGYYRENFDFEYEIDRATDILGFGEIGGVGQLGYKVTQFAQYDWDYMNDDLVAYPVINDTESDYKSYSDISGGMLLSSLCNLARIIDNPETKQEPFELIIRWCKKFIHPYFVDDVNTLVRDPNFTPTEIAMVLKKEATFSISKFMEDLNRIYFASRFYAAIDAACMGQEELILDICKAGRYFDPVPYFEKYRYIPVEQPDADYSSAGGDLLQEMMIDAKMQGQPLDNDIVRTPYDDYDELRAKLVDLIPSFQMRPKLHAKSNRYIFSADVHSIFDICWYTFARMVVDDAPPEKKTANKEYTGVVAVCINCGRYFYRKRGNQMYCRRKECQSARKAKNQKDKRARDRLEKANESV